MFLTNDVVLAITCVKYYVQFNLTPYLCSRNFIKYKTFQ